MFHHHKLLSLLVFLICALGAYIASEISHVEKHYNSAQKEVAEKKELWIKSQPKTFEYKVREGCMFSSSVRVHVKNGAASYTEIEGNYWVRDLTNVESLFDKLIIAYKVARKVEVSWNELGYPERARIDWSEAIDDECGYQILDFEIRDGA